MSSNVLLWLYDKVVQSLSVCIALQRSIIEIQKKFPISPWAPFQIVGENIALSNDEIKEIRLNPFYQVNREKITYIFLSVLCKKEFDIWLCRFPSDFYFRKTNIKDDVKLDEKIGRNSVTIDESKKKIKMPRYFNK